MLAFFLWLHRDKLIPGCHEVWRCLIPGALLSGMSAASKADRDHIHWGNQRQWFSYQPGDPLSFAWRFLLYEQRHPRGSTKDAPAFSPDASDTPFGDTLLRANDVVALWMCLSHIDRETEQKQTDRENSLIQQTERQSRNRDRQREQPETTDRETEQRQRQTERQQTKTDGEGYNTTQQTQISVLPGIKSL